jgi:hypothetical protein
MVIHTAKPPLTNEIGCSKYPKLFDTLVRPKWVLENRKGVISASMKKGKMI